jgi:acyl-CoA synthetase (AMP-forming)/AMP-acid ligase II
MVIGDLLASAAAARPDKDAAICEDRRLSYAALDAAANRFAHFVLERGMRPGETLALMARNTIDHAIAYFGAARAGVVLAELSTRFTREELRHALGLARARAIVLERPYAELLDARAAAELQIVAFDPDGGATGLATLIAGQSAAPPGVALDPEAAYCITFTGGTTGRSKGAAASHHARILSAGYARRDFRLSARDVLAVASPLYHAAGLYIWFQPGVMVGATSVLMPAWNAGRFIELVERRGITAAFFVPAQLAMVLDDPGFDARRLETLERIVYGGSPARPELIARAEAALPHVAFIQNYGQTETGPLISAQPEDRKVNPRAIGRAPADIDIEIFKAPGVAAAAGEVGELATRGAHVMLGYVGDADATAQCFKGGDGWAWTGDLALRDASGLIELVGRSKEIIISGGVNVYPAEIEEALLGNPAVADCAVFGMPDDVWGELPAAAVVLHADAPVAADDLLAFCAGQIARHKRPRAIFLVDAIPRTAAGKTQRGVLRERFAGARRP